MSSTSYPRHLLMVWCLMHFARRTDAPMHYAHTTHSGRSVCAHTHTCNGSRRHLVPIRFFCSSLHLSSYCIFFLQLFHFARLEHDVGKTIFFLVRPNTPCVCCIVFTVHTAVAHTMAILHVTLYAVCISHMRHKTHPLFCGKRFIHLLRKCKPIHRSVGWLQSGVGSEIWQTDIACIYGVFISIEIHALAFEWMPFKTGTQCPISYRIPNNLKHSTDKNSIQFIVLRFNAFNLQSNQHNVHFSFHQRQFIISK